MAYEPGNGHTGLGGGTDGVAQGTMAESSTQQGLLGSKREYEDGRIFRYAHFVSAVNRGIICSQDVSVSLVDVIDGKATAAAIGATQITLTDTDEWGVTGTAFASDIYQGGYFAPEDDDGEGYSYRISGNVGATTAGVVVLDLFDPLITAITTDTDVSIIGPLWKNCKIAVPNSDTVVCGVSVIGVTAGYYAWVQTWGVANVLTEVVGTTAPSIGNPAFLDDGTNGAVGPFAGVASNTTLNAGDWDTPYIGDFLTTATDAAHSAVFLKIQP